jgi:calcineurin-like phosphoesterase family protein
LRAFWISLASAVALAIGASAAVAAKGGITATITAGPSGTVASTTATFSFTSSQRGASFRCSLDNSSWANCSSPWTYSKLSDRTHTFSVVATYRGSTSSAVTRSWIVDTTPPPVPTIGSAPSGTTSSAQASISFSETDRTATLLCSLDDAAASPCTSPATYQSLGQGAHTFRVTARDAAGNTSAAATATWTVDTAPPPTPSITSGPADPTAATTASFSFSDAEEGATFSCSLDGGPAVACTSPTDYAGLAAGAHSFTVGARDAAGNRSGDVTYTWTVRELTNYLTNGSFEGSTSGWTSWQGTVSLATDGKVGANAAKVAVNAGQTAFSFYPLTRPISPTTTGHAYSANGWVRSDTPGRQVCLFIREFSSAGVQTAQRSSCVTTQTGWTRFAQVDYTTAQAGGQLTAFVQESGAAAGDTFEADDLQLTDYIAPPPPPPTPPPAGNTNYLTNGSFEGSTAGWTSWQGTVSLATDGKVGANAAKVALNAGATSFSFYPASRPISSTTAGHAYSANGWVRSDTPGGQVCLFIREFDAAGTQLPQRSTCTTTTRTWTQFPQADYTTAQSGGQLTVFLQESSPLAGETFEVDGLQLTDTPPPAPSSDPLVLAAGDAACAPSDPDYNAGNGTGTRCAQDATADLMASITGVSAFLALGDEQYQCGELANFRAAYAPSWGRLDAIVHPVPGNHEYGDDAAGCTPSNAQGYFTYFGSKAGDPAKGYYSFDVGAWHVIALNSDCRAVACNYGSAQERWLRSDLAAHPQACTLAYWHVPRWSAGRMGDNSTYATWWSDLYNAHADLVLGGHDHTYQRMTAMNPSGAIDANGITQLVVGTGGEELMPTMNPRPTLVTGNTTTFGVVKLSLHANGWNGAFVPVAGGTYSDSFSGSCH